MRASPIKSLSQDDAHNEAVEGKSFSEDEDENHADENLFLLSIGADAWVAYYTDAEACC